MDVQTVSIALAGIGIFIASINFIVMSRKADQQRHMELFMGIYDRFHADDFTKAQMDYNLWDWGDASNLIDDQYIIDNAAEYGQFFKLSKYYEGIGVLVTRGLFDLDLVEDLMGNNVIGFWEKAKPVFKEMQRRWDPRHGNSIEALYDAVIDLRKQRAPASI